MEFIPSVRAIARASVLLCFLASFGFVLFESRASIDERAEFHQAQGRTDITPPDDVPVPSQENLDLAMAMFGIQVPTGALYPRYDADLADRGLTTRSTMGGDAEVTIGPAAFASWGLLGSTLAHELEVHCQQNLFFIYVMDIIGLDGTGEAERQAYLHELRNAERFGLPVEEASLIADTMEFYYPDRLSSQGPGPVLTVQRWLARNFLVSER